MHSCDCLLQGFQGRKQSPRILLDRLTMSFADFLPNKPSDIIIEHMNKLLNPDMFKHSRPSRNTWHHRRMNSKWGQFSKRPAKASISLCKYLEGIDEARAGMSVGLAAKTHFLISVSSFKRRLRIKALFIKPSLRAASMAWETKVKTIMDLLLQNSSISTTSHFCNHHFA